MKQVAYYDEFMVQPITGGKWLVTSGELALVVDFADILRECFREAFGDVGQEDR